MKTTQEWVKGIEEKLRAAGVQAPQADAQWLIAAATGTPPHHWRLEEKILSEEVLQRLDEWVARRCKREPLQYILGTAPFGEFILEVDPRVLIPRPETECLLEQIPLYWPQVPEHFLDLGTGSGALAIGLAQCFPEAYGVAVDRCAEALQLAQKNIVQQGLQDRLSCLESDWFSCVTGSFDIIVANPPYLTQEEWVQAAPEVRDHEPLCALVAQDEGLADLKHLLEQASSFLTPKGCLVLETGLGHPQKLKNLAASLLYARTFASTDLLGRERFFWAFMP